MRAHMRSSPDPAFCTAPDVRGRHHSLTATRPPWKLRSSTNLTCYRRVVICEPRIAPIERRKGAGGRSWHSHILLPSRSLRHSASSGRRGGLRHIAPRRLLFWCSPASFSWELSHILPVASACYSARPAETFGWEATTRIWTVSRRSHHDLLPSSLDDADISHA